MPHSETVTARIPAGLAKKVREKLRKTDLEMSDVLRAGLRSFVGDEGAEASVDVQVFDLLVGAKNVLNELASRAMIVEPATQEATAFVRDFSALLIELERARRKARRRVQAALRREKASRETETRPSEN
jgi:hypothetical protein